MTDEHAEFDAMLPWLAAGTLPEEDRVRVGRHLEGCARCRERFDDHRALAALALRHDPEPHMQHVEAGVLVHYVEDPRHLDPEVRDWIETRLASCEDCRGAAQCLRALESATAAPSLADRLRSALESIRGFALQPAAALAYLVVAAWLAGTLATRPSPAPVALARVGDAVVLEGETAMRDEAGRAAPAGVVPGGGDALLLELRTALVPADVERDASAFEVELASGGTTVWARRLEARDFARRGERVSVFVSLHPGGLRGEGPFTLRVRARRPGDPLDGQELYRRSFRLDRGRP